MIAASNLVFDTHVPPPEAYDGTGWWLIFQGHRLIVTAKSEGAGVAIPRFTAPEDWPTPLERVHYLGTLEGDPCYVAELSDEKPLPEGFQKASLRRLFGRLDDQILRVAGRAVHILDWDRNHQFCGRCGTATAPAEDWAKVCPNCGLRAYPRISPAVIMAVLRDDRILLAHAGRHPAGLYSVLAGFAEPGETLEEAVRREVREEVGLEVKNIRYFGSQPWPFPDSLMIAFVCDYAGGEIELTDSELADAGWYRPGEFPGVTPPAEISIAGRLIAWFVEQVAGEDTV